MTTPLGQTQQQIGHNATHYYAPHQPQYYAPPPPTANYYCYPPTAAGWAGIPLISTAQRRPTGANNRKFNTISRTRSLGGFDDDKSLSTLAIHAQGAPLILRYNRKQGGGVKKEPAARTTSLVVVEKIAETSAMDDAAADNNNNNSGETCLPRIIKPRKRRKKDRKPVVQVQQPEAAQTKAAPVLESSCSCRCCDPAGKIWAFPLRRSCSDNSAEVAEETRRKDVGVIGGGRAAARTEWRSVPGSLDDGTRLAAERKSSLSDSGDSGCDILSGINLADDLFSDKLNNELAKKFNESLDLKVQLLPQQQLQHNNELSSSDSGSVFSDSVLSDSGCPADLFVNFDSISKNHLFSANNISKLSNLLFDDNLATPPTPQSPAIAAAPNSPNNGLFNVVNNNNNRYQLMNQHQQQQQLLYNDRPFVFIPDKDRENEVLNCFDMVWNWNGS